MAVNSTTRIAGPFTGNGSTTVFSFNFVVFATTDLFVVVVDGNGTLTALVLDTDFTAVLNGDQDTSPGGSITLTVALATGSLMTITSSIETLQEVILANLGGFFPDVLNTVFDKLTVLTQQVQQAANQAIKLGLTDDLSTAQLPPAVARANSFIAFDGDGNVAVAPLLGMIDFVTAIFTGSATKLAGNANPTASLSGGDGEYELLIGVPVGTVAVGTTATGAPGTSAAVHDSGSPGSSVLNFTIPQGVAGPPTSFLGAWSSGTTYSIGQAVYFAGTSSSYVSLTSANLNNNPSSSPSHWSLMSPGGTPTVFGGPWAVGTTYAQGTSVSHTNGNGYVSLVASNVGNDPSTSPSQWALQVAKGAAGEVQVADLVSSIGGAVSGTIGNATSSSTAAVSVANTVQSPFPVAGYLKTLTVYVSAHSGGANIVVLVLSQAALVFTQVARYTFPVKNNGANVYVDGTDFSMIPLAAGQFLAIYCDGTWTLEFQTSFSAPFPYQIFGDPGTGSATWASNPSGLIATTYQMYELPDLVTDSDVTSAIDAAITPATYTVGALSGGGGNSATAISVITTTPAATLGTISQVDATVNAFTSGGTFWLAVFENTGGSNFQVVSRTALTATGTGHQTWVGGTDYVAPVILAGQYAGWISINPAAEIQYGVGSGSVLFFTPDPGSGPQAYSVGGPPSVLFTIQPPPLANEGYVNAAVTNKFITKPVAGSVIIFHGSSITAGLGVSASQCFAGLIAAAQWAAGATVYNIGISGQTSTGCLAQYTATSGNPNMPSGVSPHSLGPNVSHNPAPCWLILDLTEITNDFQNSIATATSISNLQSLVSAAKTDGYIVVLLTSPILGIGSLSSPLGGVNAASATQNRAVASAVRTGVIPWDLFGELSDVIPDQHNAVYYQDGTHPTVAGHKALANVILSVLVSGGGASNFNKDYHHDPNTFIAGVIIPDSAGSLWKLVVSTGGTLSATAYTPVDTDE